MLSFGPPGSKCSTNTVKQTKGLNGTSTVLKHVNVKSVIFPLGDCFYLRAVGDFRLQLMLWSNQHGLNKPSFDLLVCR